MRSFLLGADAGVGMGARAWYRLRAGTVEKQQKLGRESMSSEKSMAKIKVKMTSTKKWYETI
jgi:hypothetical protein